MAESRTQSPILIDNFLLAARQSVQAPSALAPLRRFVSRLSSVVFRLIKKEPEGSFSYFTNLSKRSKMLVRRFRNLFMMLRLPRLMKMQVPLNFKNKRR